MQLCWDCPETCSSKPGFVKSFKEEYFWLRQKDFLKTHTHTHRRLTAVWDVFFPAGDISGHLIFRDDICDIFKIRLSHNLMSRRSGGFPGLTHLVEGCLSGLGLCSPIPRRQPLWLQRTWSQQLFWASKTVMAAWDHGAGWSSGLKTTLWGKGEGRMTFPPVIKTT